MDLVLNVGDSTRFQRNVNVAELKPFAVQETHMFNRFCFGTLLLAGFVVSFTGCTASSGLDSIQVTPITNALVAGGPTLQLTATGIYGNAAHTHTQDITTQVTWASSSSGIASVGATTGVVTAAGNGTATITATAMGYKGPVTSSVTVTVTGGGTTSSTRADGLISLTIVPSSLSVLDLQGTGNFLAIGTYATPPTVRDVTNLPNTTWLSSFPNSFPVNTNSGGNTGATAGIVTAYGSGGTNITVEVADTGSTSTTPSFAYAQATFSCPLTLPCPCTLAHGGCVPDVTVCSTPVPGSCFPGSQGSALLSTVTVYNEGVNTTNWLVTAPSATHTPNVMHCGPGWAGAGGSVCVATYPVGTPITITATQPTGTGTFGGWSSNCLPINGGTINPNPSTAAGPNMCTLTPTASSETVGVIFN
jgi:hypothetical protein